MQNFQRSNEKQAVVAERPPRQKRSKTIPNDTHFPGPLFPAVRRNTTPNKPRPDLRVFIDSDSSSTHSSTPSSSSSSSNASSFNVNSFAERDWMYPSFLGPHMGRSAVKVKGNRAQKQEFRVEKQRIPALEKEEEVKEKEVEVEVEVTAVSQTLSSSGSQTQSGGRTRGLKGSLMHYLVSI